MLAAKVFAMTLDFVSLPALTIPTPFGRVLHKVLMSDFPSEELKRGNRDAEPIISEDEGLQSRWGRRRKKPINYENLPKNSLQHLAAKLGKSSRQVRRLCQAGLVPNAYRTAGGHWRIRNSSAILVRVREAIRGRTRNREFVNRKKYLQAQKAQEVPLREELLYGERAYSMGPYKHNVGLAITMLHRADKPVTVASVAAEMGIARSTLYRQIGRNQLKGMIAAYTIDSQGQTIEEYSKRLEHSNGSDDSSTID